MYNFPISNGTIPCPKKVISRKGEDLPNLAYTHWIHLDQLLLNAIIASLYNSIMPLIASAMTSNEAWTNYCQPL